MRFTLLAIVLSMVGNLDTARAQDREPDVPPNRVLLDQPVGTAGQRLTVTRGPDRDPSLFSFWKNDALHDATGLAMVEQIRNVYEVRVELKSPDTDTLLLASRLRVEGGMAQNNGLVVLDARVEPRNIVLAMAEGPFLTLWQISIGGQSTLALFRADKLWTPFAALSQLSERIVAMKLGRTDDGRLTAEVTDKRVGQHTFYEEAEIGSLRFKAGREWVENEREEEEKAK